MMTHLRMYMAARPGQIATFTQRTVMSVENDPSHDGRLLLQVTIVT